MALVLAGSALFAAAKSQFVADDFSITIPAGWEYDYDANDMDGMVFIAESLYSKDEEFTETVSIKKDVLAPNEKFTAKSYLEALLEDCARRNERFELLANYKNLAAVRYIHPDINNGTDVVQYIRIVIKKNVAYIICATALPETIKAYEDDFNTIVLSFK